MNRYKFDLLLKEFLFLDKVLRVRETFANSSLYKKADDFTERKKQAEAEKDSNYYMFSWKEEGDYIYPTYIEVPHSILIKRGDDNLLSQTPQFDGYSSSGHYREERSDYCAVSGENIVWLGAEGIFNHGDGSSEEEVSDNIGEQLFSKKLSPDFIVRVDREELGYNKKINIIIYKMNKFDLVGYHCGQLDKAVRQLKDEIVAVCEKGEGIQEII